MFLSPVFLSLNPVIPTIFLGELVSQNFHSHQKDVVALLGLSFLMELIWAEFLFVLETNRKYEKSD